MFHFVATFFVATCAGHLKQECIADFLDQMLSNTIDPRRALDVAVPVPLEVVPISIGKLVE